MHEKPIFMSIEDVHFLFASYDINIFTKWTYWELAFDLGHQRHRWKTVSDKFQTLVPLYRSYIFCRELGFSYYAVLCVFFFFFFGSNLFWCWLFASKAAPILTWFMSFTWNDRDVTKAKTIIDRVSTNIATLHQCDLVKLAWLSCSDFMYFFDVLLCPSIIYWRAIRFVIDRV